MHEPKKPEEGTILALRPSPCPAIPVLDAILGGWL
jgi:hypothetical protein